MNWTTASMDLNDNQTRTRSIDLNQFTVWGGKFLYKSTRLNTSIILIATVFSFYFSDPFLMEGLLYYIAPFGPSWSYTCWSSEPLFVGMAIIARPADTRPGPTLMGQILPGPIKNRVGFGFLVKPGPNLNSTRPGYKIRELQKKPSYIYA